MMPVQKGDAILTEGLVESVDGEDDAVHPGIVTRVLGIGKSKYAHTYTEVDAVVFLSRRPPTILASLRLYWSEAIAADELERQRAAAEDPQKVEMVAWPK